MTFVCYYLCGFLSSMRWPRKMGIPFFRKNVVDFFLVKLVIEQMTESAILLGAIRPKVAISLIADVTHKRDLARKPAQELWLFLDPTKTIKSHPELEPAKVICLYTSLHLPAHYTVKTARCLGKSQIV